MKLKVTRYKPSGKYYDEFAVDVPPLRVWDEEFEPELRAAIEEACPRVNHSFAHAVENHPASNPDPGEDRIPFHSHLYYPGDLEP
jgi:hypothetical protein